jgi:hypothetical protein
VLDATAFDDSDSSDPASKIVPVEADASGCDWRSDHLVPVQVLPPMKAGVILAMRQAISSREGRTEVVREGASQIEQIE